MSMPAGPVGGRRPRVLVVAVAVAALLLAGCTAGTGSTSSGGGSAARSSLATSSLASSGSAASTGLGSSSPRSDLSSGSTSSPTGDGSPESTGGSRPATSESTGGTGPAAPDSTRAPALPTALPPATLRAPTGAAAVVDGATPGAISIAVSRALFETAPAVVVLDAADAAGMDPAGRQAVRLGAPLLLLDRGRGGVSAGSTGSAASSSPASSSPATFSGEQAGLLIAEVKRLRPLVVLAVGAGTAAELDGRLPVPVVTDPASLPVAPKSRGDSGMAVLLNRNADPAHPAGAAAAAASARAAGARVVSVAGWDVRADPAAIAALAANPPTRVLAVGAGFGPMDRLAQRLAVAATGVQLPGGGQVMFPGRRLIALYGHPGTPALGVLGHQGLSQSIARAAAVAQPYRSLSSAPVVPAFEIIATIADAGPGPDGDYSSMSSVASLLPWVRAAGKAGMYVVLDLQPGRADFLDQAKQYTPLLELPYVGLALDPEWKLGPGQLPLRQIGGVDAAEVNRVIGWLAELTAVQHLPQKLLVLHQFRLSMLRDEAQINVGSDQVAVLIHMDGLGTPNLKDGTWAAVTAAAPAGVFFGWKNFYAKDTPMLTPAQTMARKPTPVMISYQ